MLHVNPHLPVQLPHVPLAREGTKFGPYKLIYVHHWPVQEHPLNLGLSSFDSTMLRIRMDWRKSTWWAGRRVGSSNSSDCTFCETLLSITLLDTLQQPLHQQYIPYRLSDFVQSWMFIKCKDMWNSKKRRNYKMPPQGKLNWEFWPAFLQEVLSSGAPTRPVCVCTDCTLARCHWCRERARSPLFSADGVVNCDGGLRHVLGVESLLPSWCLFTGPTIMNQTQLGWWKGVTFIRILRCTICQEENTKDAHTA